MGNDPIVEILAEKRSGLTDRIAKELIRNFGSYNSAPYMKLVGMEDKHLDGHRKLIVWTPDGERKILAEVYGNEVIPANLLDIDMTKYNSTMGVVRYASVHVSTDFDPKEPSVSPKFPYEVATFLLDPVADNAEMIARVACGLPLELIKLDGLKLTLEQQEQFRIVPYWEGLGKVDFNHFKYDQFRKLGMDGLTKAFLYANKHGE